MVQNIIRNERDNDGLDGYLKPSESVVWCSLLSCAGIRTDLTVTKEVITVILQFTNLAPRFPFFRILSYKGFRRFL